VSFYQWPAYVAVAERRRRAERKLAQLRKKGEPVAPVKIEGRVIAASFWGKSWCENLERYSDYATRLPRGRSYVRNGSVVDMQIAPGKVAAMVAGSDLYHVEVTIEPVARSRWKSICRDCWMNGTTGMITIYRKGQKVLPRRKYLGTSRAR